MALCLEKALLELEDIISKSTDKGKQVDAIHTAFRKAFVSIIYLLSIQKLRLFELS